MNEFVKEGLKCAYCRKRFKKEDEIVVVDANPDESVHIECEYEFLRNCHFNQIFDYEELKEMLKERHERDKD